MIQQIDYNIMLWIQTYMRSEWMDFFMKMMTLLGDWLIVWTMVLVIYYVLKKKKQSALQLVLSLLISMILNQILLKNIVRRPRPFLIHTDLQSLIEQPTSFSFPSSHSASSFAFASSVTTNIKWIGVVGFVIAALIAVSRVYLNVHYPSDILVGAMVGILSSQIVRKFLTKY